MADLGNELANSYSAADAKSQIRIKVALSTLPIEDVGPVSKVTAYIELASQPSSRSADQALSIYPPRPESTLFMSDVCFLNNFSFHFCFSIFIGTLLATSKFSIE
ncbi:unnamed protein product [Dibothriocephalus latus]|uniref:Uncharacterized protein n=1 Tax=Dibothriocephalus latus TaxID=60516 RepID=A0A3P7LJU4_DIBLA|nr:unnamed protein product [Dibothriocephalus latus]